MPPKTPTQKGGGGGAKTPQGSSGKKKGRDRQSISEAEPPPPAIDALLQISRSDVSGPEKLTMATADMRRMTFRAGDWVVVKSKRQGEEEDLDPYQGLVVLRAWPGPTVPPGMVVGGPPFVTGQFVRAHAGADINVTVQPLRTSAYRVVPLASAVIRLLTGRERQESPPYRHAGSGLYFRERLKDTMNGTLIFPGLTLSITVFGRTYRFEVTSTVGEEATPPPPPPSPPPPSVSAQVGDEDDAALAKDLSTLSLGEGSSSTVGQHHPSPPPPPREGGSVPIYSVGRASLLTLLDGTENGGRSLGGGEEEDPWAMVGGLDAQVAELRQGIELPLLSPETFERYGLKPPRGLLVTGPPGTGKSTVLKAAGREFRARGVHVMPLSGPELVSHLVGETEANLRRLFEEAKGRAPTLILLDEAEVLCRKREATGSEGDKRAVSTFLALMDGYAQMDRVMVLAATSQPSLLDPAVRRPGRFDREIELGVPGEQARLSILRVLLRQAAAGQGRGHQKEEEDGGGGGGSSSLCADDEAIAYVASRAHGFVGADLLLLCKEAALEVVRRQQREDQQVKKQGGPPNEQDGGGAAAAGAGDFMVREEDLRAALKRVRPSALREVTVEVPRVHWTDIGGQEGVKQALREAVEWPLTHPDAFLRMGISPPKGVLLYGPPGCSKTLMARALATESSMNFLAVKGPELLSKWLGESERALQSLFKKARAAAPTVIFFDEVDALAGKRGGGDSRASERVLSQLLTELDGIQPLKRVVVIAATNRPDLIDPALLRPGRIGRMVYVPPPDLDSRAEIITIALRGVATEDVQVDHLARMTEGFSGAEVVAVCREAALVAIGEDPENASCLRPHHFEQAIRTWKPQITQDMLAFYGRWASTHSDAL